MPISSPKLQTVALIGGGDLMLQAARDLHGQKLDVIAVFAPRHAQEKLTLDGRVTRDAFAAEGITTQIIEDINSWPGLSGAPWTTSGAVALCFGPAWVFNESVRSSFSHGMYNINAIPVPRYLGGAHYSWQILNGDRDGGCVLQEITASLDRGDILARRAFEIPLSARTPQDYSKVYFEECRGFATDAIAGMTAERPFKREPFSQINENRLYLPRLFTRENAWIDWSWSATEIERFCCAFDAPYIGAASFLDNVTVRLRSVTAQDADRSSRHPFLAGLVIRRSANTAWIAARDGILEIQEAKLEDGSNAMQELKEGRRFATSAERLHRAATWRMQIDGCGIKEGIGS